MEKLWADTGSLSINKKGEQLCGDKVEVIGSPDGALTLVLADGLGSGVKANILSTLTSKILCTMIAAGMPLEDCVDTVVNTLPVCQLRKVAYSTFTILHIEEGRTARIIQFDNPHVILLRGGQSLAYPTTSRTVGDKTVLESSLPLQLGDMLVAMSDGVTYAGIGKGLSFGWQWENVAAYAQKIFTPALSAKALAGALVEECARLSRGEVGDDTTAACIKIRQPAPVNLMIGPPADPLQLGPMMRSFFALPGERVVCGGTTSTLAAQYLGRPLRPSIDYFDPAIPPIAHVEGIDLVTEGVITLSRVVEYGSRALSGGSAEPPWQGGRDAAALICRKLFEEATSVNFFVGKAINPAHQNPDLPIHFGIKLRLIQDLAGQLEQLGKQVTLQYF